MVKAGVEDRHLPLKIEWPSGASGYIVSCPQDETLDNPLPCLSGLGDVLLGTFNDLQSHMLAPRLQLGAEKPSFYRLPFPAVLPFLESHRIKSGGYGSVSKIKIHAAHHSSRPTDEEGHFAVKRLLSGDYSQFRQEVEVLARFSVEGKTHNHLIRLLQPSSTKGMVTWSFRWRRET